MSFLGTLLKGAVGFVTGGPAGAALAIGTALTRRPAAPMIVPTLMPPTFSPGMDIFTRPMGMPMGMTCPPGTACTGTSYDGLCMGACNPIGGRMAGMMPGMAGCTPKGFHWNKSRYAVCGPGGMAPACIPKMSKLVRNRRLNPANGHAAKRAVRRISATHKLLKRIEKNIRAIKGIPRARREREDRGREITTVRG